jgi:hypothetical protein
VHVRVVNSVASLSRNTASEALYLASGSECHVNASLLELNSAGKVGGAIAVEFGSRLDVIDSTMRSNALSAAGVGGAVGVVFQAQLISKFKLAMSETSFGNC